MSYSSEVLADSPLAYWRLGETSGSTAADATGNGRTVAHVGSLTVGVPSLLATDASDKAVSYSGGYSRIDGAAWMEQANFTVEALVQPTSTALSTDSPLASRWVNSFPSGCRWYLWISGGKFVGVLFDSGGTNRSVTGATSLVAGQRYHVALTYDGATIRLFVNGVLDGSTAWAGTINSTGGPFLDFARVADAISASLTLDEVAFYGSALSPTRLAAHADAAFSANTTGTINATLPALSANLAATYSAPPITGILAAPLPALTANLVASADVASVSGTVDSILPALSASLSGAVQGRSGLGLILDSDAVLTIVDVLEPEPTVPPGTPATVLHIIAPTVPVPTLVAGRPQ